MIIKTVLNLQCNTDEESKICMENIFGKIESKYGKFYNEETKKVSGHLSLSHINGNHILWVVTYDKIGIHESYRKGVTVTKKADDVVKYTGETITQSAIKKLF
jgi:hypothetical protein